MNATIIPFKPKAPYRDERGFLRTADGVLHVSEPCQERKIYVIFWTPGRPRARKRWLVWIFFGDGLFDEIELHMKDDWRAAMWRARLEHRKYGFEIVDMGVPK